MRPFRFVHAADLHLDSPFRGLGTAVPAELHERITASTFAALHRIIDIALAERVDFVLFSGDTYDAAARSLHAELKFQEAMQQLAEHRIQAFIVHGNHDPAEGQKAALAWPDTVHVFATNEVEMRPAYDRAGQVVAHIYGISYATAAVTDNLALQFKASDPHMFNIAMLHCNVDGDRFHEPYAPCTIGQLIAAQMDYWALGHVHKRSVLHTEPHIVYSGNTQGRSVRELGERGCYVVDVDETGRVALTFHRTDTLTWHHELVSIEQMSSEQDVADACDAMLTRIRHEAVSGGRAAIIRLTLSGRGELHHTLQHLHVKEQLSKFLRDKYIRMWRNDDPKSFVWLEDIIVATGAEVDESRLRQEQSFLSDVLRLSETVAQHHAEQGTLHPLLAEALDALFSHRQAGPYIAHLVREEPFKWLQIAEQMAIDLLYEHEEQR